MVLVQINGYTNTTQYLTFFLWFLFYHFLSVSNWNNILWRVRINLVLWQLAHIFITSYLSWKGYATTTKNDQSELLMYTNGCTSFVFYGSSLLVNDAIYNVWWWMFWIPTSHYGSIIFTIFCKIGLWNSVSSK